MTFSTGTFSSPVDGIALATYAWDDVSEPRAVVQIAHGLAEHAGRYDRLAAELNAAGYLVRATDHRGHGRSIVGVPGDFGAAGFDGLIADVAAYGADLRAANPDLPLVLIGHSMGSFATQAVLLDHSEQYAAAVLSGSTALDQLAIAMAEAAAQPDAPAGLEAFNVGFEHRTGYEWLSRDDAEVDRYVADPLCGFDLPEETVPALFGPAARLAVPSTVRSDLPLLIASGTADPLAGGGALIELLGQRYRDAGLTDVTVKLYDDARHEIFNETDRDEITRDVIGWLSERT
ncbi:alpha/beta hydrolase [Nocardioides albidus]|uniref:Alpha/beta hydrolase n=1 Tax=Nocardioides albidus TaxID=1517589 RepID=A0A5C4WCU6_9ACTN|nr:alpha/beta hydrolase [Nocardioides albidus]TNM46104.1 alpha/beta hydrolase [Nocardioides albidus]